MTNELRAPTMNERFQGYAKVGLPVAPNDVIGIQLREKGLKDPP
jgi:hypothetical protein